jgi:peroxiredoxin
MDEKVVMRQTETTLPAPPAVGQPAPDFRLDSIRGRPMRLADFRGRRVILWLSRGIY